MFGKRGGPDEMTQAPAPAITSAAAPKAAKATPGPAAASGSAAARPQLAPAPSTPVAIAVDNRTDDYYQVKTTIFSALIDTIDLAQLAQLDVDSAREEIRDIVNEIISIKAVVMSIAEQEH